MLLNKEEVLYYSCNYFILMNLLTRQYTLIPKEHVTSSTINTANQSINSKNTSNGDRTQRPYTCAKTRVYHENSNDCLTPHVKKDAIYLIKKISRPKHPLNLTEQSTVVVAIENG